MLYAVPFFLLFETAIVFPSPNDVTVYTQFAHPAAPLAIDQMKAELAAIMLPLNLRLNWRSIDKSSGHETVAELMVVTFKGECETDWLPPIDPGRGALGWTHISDGDILPFTDVDCDKIRDLLSHQLSMSLPPERTRMLGRAMARVLAHEMYHFLLHTTRHASYGIAKAYYTAPELAAQSLRFDYPELLLAMQESTRGPFASLPPKAILWAPVSLLADPD